MPRIIKSFHEVDIRNNKINNELTDKKLSLKIFHKNHEKKLSSLLELQQKIEQ
jgi:hypothetical protein